MKPGTESFYAQVVQRVIVHVASHLDEALALETMAAQACLSPFHFHRVFRGMVGETPMELGRRLRMERAAWRLLHTEQPVTVVAFDAGYETHEAFSRAFRSNYAESPTAFRRRPRARVELAAPCGVHFRTDGHVPHFIPRNSGGRTMQVDIARYPELRVGTVRHVGLTEQRIPGGEYASTVHTGAYEQLGDTWARFMGEWLPASGRRLAPGVSYEVYHNTPMDTPTERLKTELRLPLA